MPTTASGAGRRGAEAFVAHYIDVLNYVTFGGSPAAARALETGNCTSCDRMLSAVAAVYKNGGSVEGGQWEPTPVGGVDSPDGYVVDVRIKFDPQVVFRSENGPPEEYAGGSELASFILKRTDSGWLVDAWTRAE